MKHISSINEICHKHPHWKKLFLMWESKIDSFDYLLLETTFKYYLKHKNLLKKTINPHTEQSLLLFCKNNNLDILEHFNEKVRNQVDFLSRKNYVKNLLSSGYSHLYSNDVFDKMIELIELVGIQVFKKMFAKKIARFHNTDALIESLNKYKNDFLNWNKDFILSKVKERNIELISNQENKIVILIDNYNDSKLLGASSWCISYSNYFFNFYNAEGHILFIFDFNKSYSDLDSLVGITLDTSLTIKFCHKRDDTTHNISFDFKTDFVDYINLKKDNDLNIALQFSTIDDINKNFSGIKTLSIKQLKSLLKNNNIDFICCFVFDILEKKYFSYEAIELLLKYFSSKDTYLIYFKRFLKYFNLKACDYDNKAIIEAFDNNAHDIVKYFLSFEDKSYLMKSSINITSYLIRNNKSKEFINFLFDENNNLNLNKSNLNYNLINKDNKKDFLFPVVKRLTSDFQFNSSADYSWGELTYIFDFFAEIEEYSYLERLITLTQSTNLLPSKINLGKLFKEDRNHLILYLLNKYPDIFSLEFEISDMSSFASINIDSFETAFSFFDYLFENKKITKKHYSNVLYNMFFDFFSDTCYYLFEDDMISFSVDTLIKKHIYYIDFNKDKGRIIANSFMNFNYETLCQLINVDEIDFSIRDNLALYYYFKENRIDETILLIKNEKVRKKINIDWINESFDENKKQLFLNLLKEQSISL